MKATDTDISYISILQEKREKPKLIQVHLATVSQKQAMLQITNLIIASDNEDKKKLFITSDPSMKVRRRNKELRKELTERLIKD